MARLVFWHLARTVLAIWALASAVFLLSYRDLDVAAQLALPDTSEASAASAGASASVAGQRSRQLAAVRQRLGLDLPLFYVSRSVGPARRWRWNGQANQYHRWATRLLHGNLGTSFRTGQAVATRLRVALAFTLPLTGTAGLLAVLAAVGLGQRLAARPWWHRPVRAALTTVHGLPLFVVALALLLLFANPDVFAWFPAYGLAPPADGVATSPGSYLAHLALPVFALVLTALPELTLQLEAALAHELSTDYATTARAKGLAERAVIRHHALRNALLPTLTQLAALLPALVAGAVVVEVIFALPGMGRLLADAAAARDYPVLVGGVLLTGAARLLALLLADLLYFWADPRIRWQS
jgi:peptide/nickel transport system permease protein